MDAEDLQKMTQLAIIQTAKINFRMLRCAQRNDEEAYRRANHGLRLTNCDAEMLI